MSYLKQFVIPFGGLKAGIHEYDYQVGQRFFDEFEYSEVKKGDLHIAVTLDKQTRLLQFEVVIRGSIEVICDRCNEPFMLPIEGSYRMFVKFGTAYSEESDDVFVIPEAQTQIDLSHHLYEYISLLLPYRRIHPDDENGVSLCNPLVLKKLEELSGGHHTDPRWDVLREIDVE